MGNSNRFTYKVQKFCRCCGEQFEGYVRSKFCPTCAKLTRQEQRLKKNHCDASKEDTLEGLSRFLLKWRRNRLEEDREEARKKRIRLELQADRTINALQVCPFYGSKSTTCFFCKRGKELKNYGTTILSSRRCPDHPTAPDGTRLVQRTTNWKDGDSTQGITKEYYYITGVPKQPKVRLGNSDEDLEQLKRYNATCKRLRDSPAEYDIYL